MKFVSAILSLAMFAGTLFAQCANGTCSMVNSRLSVRSTPTKARVTLHETVKTSTVQAAPVQTKEPPVAQDALDEVNAQRAKRGLPPYIRDPGLTIGAMNVAHFRASRLMFGHTSNDFKGLPPGVPYAAAGCAAYPPSMNWLSCCTYENYRYAGAAWCMGRDGKRYMHLFVR